VTACILPGISQLNVPLCSV